MTDSPSPLTAAVPLAAALTAVTVRAPSTSLSFASTLMVVTPLFSATVAVSLPRFAGSSTAVTVTDTVAVPVSPAVSVTV